MRTTRLVFAAVLFLAAAAIVPAQSNVLVPDQPVTAKIVHSDETLQDGSYFTAYRIPARAGVTYTLTMRSSFFDTYLIVTNDAGFEEHNDDAEDGTTNSSLTFTADGTGDYVVIATTYEPGAVGTYTIELTRAAGTAGRDAAGSDTAGSGSSGGGTAGSGSAGVDPALRAGVVRVGMLGETDETLTSGEYADSYRFVATAGSVISIELESDDFDAYVILIAPAGDQMENDDARGTRNSYLERVVEHDGEYEILVTSYESGESGRYELTYRARELAEGVAVTEPAETVVYRGELDGTEETLQNGELTRTYRFTAAAGERVAFELRSQQFDAYLILEDPSGVWIEQNDDKDDGTYDSRIEMILARAGTYSLIVTTYEGGERGEYELFSSKRFIDAPEPSGAVAGMMPSGAGSLATDGQGSYYGLFVGISDYPGREDDLDFCADDAENLRDVFLSNGYASPARITLLTDRTATRNRMYDAIERYAGEMSEGDTLLLFYSGHGNSVPSATERDNRDETIELYDGAIRDDELAVALDAVRGRVILVMDACYSAGFAKDVLTRSGWFGVFSSEEDVVSYVADEFRAGGYLSHFFQDAISGSADGSAGAPEDRLVSMSELERYLFIQWYGQAGPSEDSNQHLRFERNGVSVDEVLFRL